MPRRQQAPIRIYVCSHTLPVSRRGFASVVQQGNSLPETAPGWPGEGLSLGQRLHIELQELVRWLLFGKTERSMPPCITVEKTESEAAALRVVHY